MTVIFNIFYCLGMLLIGPIYLVLRLLKGRPSLPWQDRLWRFPSPLTAKPIVWIHGVSMGEVMTARGLVKRLEATWPDYEVVVSTTTTTGLDAARRLFPNNLTFPCPFDLPFSVRRVKSRLNPQLLILMELEIWPNLLRILGQDDVPIIVVNGHLSEKSTRGYRRLMRLNPVLMNPVSQFLVQTEEIKDRLLALAIPKQRIEVLGNLKVDNLGISPHERVLPELVQKSGDQLIFVAGSTHEGEEEAVFSAYLAARKDLENLRLVLAPRHLERLDAIKAHARKLGLVTGTSIEPTCADDMNSIVLVETMGELPIIFGIADVVFLGGSLVPVGGHNVMESAAAGVVQILGTHTQSVMGFVEELESVGAAVVVDDEAGLTRELRAYLSDAPRRQAGGDAAKMVVERHRGALDRTMNVLNQYGPS